MNSSAKGFLTRCPRLVAVVALGLAGIPGLRAQLPMARLTGIFPPGGQVHSTVEVALEGQDLDETAELRFSHPGLTAKPKLAEANGQPEPNKFLVTIAPETPEGIYEVRAWGRFGLSNPRAFAVGSLPELIEASANHEASQAQLVALDRTVNGRTDNNAYDYFKFHAAQGQRVLLECLSERLDSRADPVLVLFHATGRELDRSRRAGLLDFTATEEGDYLLRVHDFLYRGGGEYFYRLQFSTGPYVDFVLPPSGLPGTKGSYTLYGRNLPGGTEVPEWKINGKTLEKLEVEITLPDASEIEKQHHFQPVRRPADVVATRYGWRLKTPRGNSNPVWIGLATAPVVAEREPNDTPDKAQKISLPCEFVGQFFPSRDWDWITFEAGKGEVYQVEIFSDRLGLPTNPFLLLQRVTKNDKGEETVSDVKEIYDQDTNIGGREFNTATRDPAWRFEVKETGLYRLLARDLFEYAEPNPAHVYRLSLRREKPDFVLVAVPEPPMPVKNDARDVPPWHLFLRKWETWPVNVLAFRRDNFNGPIDLNIDGAPPGVRTPPAQIEEGKSSQLLFLSAAADVAPWAGAVRITGRARIGEREVTRTAHGGTVIWPVGDYNNEPVESRLASEITLAISRDESYPVTVAAAENKTWSAPVGGKIEIPLRIEREGEFKENLKLKAVGVDALEKLGELEIKDKATNATLAIDLNQFKVPPGLHQISLRTVTKGKYRNQPEAAQLAEEESKKAEQAAQAAADASKKAAQRLEAAAKQVQDQEVQNKAVTEKLNAAKAAAEKAAQDEKLIAARTEAEKAVQAAAAALAKARESKAAADQTKTEAEAKAKEAEAAKKAAAERAKAANERAKPREAVITVYSPPISIEVTPKEEKVAKNEAKK
jgi:hypothetical protein